MKKKTLGLASIALAAAFSLTACGTSEQDLAKEYCDLTQDLKEATDSGDTDEIEEATEALTDWADDNKDVEGDSDEFADAVEEECGDTVSVP